MPGSDAVAGTGLTATPLPTGGTGIRARRSSAAWAVLALGTGLVVLGIVAPTLLPGVWFWDTAEAQTVPPLLGTMHPTGFPAYVILGWLASIVLGPFGEPAYRMNLLSALLLAVAVSGTVVVGRQLRVPPAVAVAAAFGLGVTPIAWEIGVAADAHALHLAFVVVLTAVLLAWERRVLAGRAARARGERGPDADRWLVAAAVVFGVGAANHSLTLLLIPPVGLYVLAVDRDVLRRPRLVLACLAGVVGTATLLYLQLPVRAGVFPAPLVYGRPDTWDGFRYIVLAEQFRGSIVDPFGDLGGKLATLVGRTGEQLGPLALLVPAGFAATIYRAPRYALLSGLAVAITCFFAASYVNADIARYYLGPAFFAWTWLAMLAAGVTDLAGALARRAERRGLMRAVTAGLLAVLLAAPAIAALPARASAADRSDDTEAQRWLDAALAGMEPDAVVVSWWSYSTTLWYGTLVEGRRPDILVVDDRTRLDRNLGEVTDVIDAHLGRRPVYVIRLEPLEIARLGTRYALTRLAAPGNVYRVVARLEAAP